MHMALGVNTNAPAFSLPDEKGEIHTNDEFKGKWVVVYFYPKDDTPGCTKEACGFRDAYHVFETKNIQVIGISKDSPKSHGKFIEKYDLPFLLLADESKKTIQEYEAWGEKKFMGRLFDGVLRISYLIDPEGIIRKVYETVKPEEHAEEILLDVQELQK